MDILDKEQYILIYRTSYLLLLTTLYAIYQNKNFMLPGSVFLTSIHYWKKPDYSYRRYLDIAVTTSALSYQHYLAYNSQYEIIYYSLMGLGKVSYIYGKYSYQKDNWNSTYAHMGFHVLANIASIILYTV